MLMNAPIATIVKIILDKNAKPIPLPINYKRFSINVGGGIQTTILTSHTNSVVIPESTMITLIS